MSSFICFFFSSRRRHTRCSRDWSSDVCSSDLDLERLDAARHYPDQDEVDRVRIAFRAPSVSGLGLATLGLAPPERLSSHEGVEVRGRSLVNRFVEATLEPSGALALRDRRTGERFFDLLRLEDGGDAGDTYTFCPPARDRV